MVELDAQGRPQTLSGDDFGPTSPIFCRRADGTRGVLKLEKPANMAEQKSLESWWAYQVMASAIMEELGCNTVHYREAESQIDGKPVRGIAVEYVEGMHELAGRVDLLRDNPDPDGAILGAVLCAWMGDFDRIVKDENIWIGPDRRVLFGDYGCAGLEHTQVLGALPKVNRTLFRTLATPENVKAALNRVGSLSDTDIEGLVSRAAAQVPDIPEGVSVELLHVLCQNRDQLVASGKIEALIGSDQPRRYDVPEGIGQALVERTSQRFGSLCRTAQEVAEGALRDVPGYAPLHGIDRESVEIQLANAIEDQRLGRPVRLQIQPESFYVWMQLAKRLFTVEESLQLGLGLKHRWAV